MTSNTLIPEMANAFTNQQADKAVIALLIAKATKAPNATGIGPNRDDYPIFTKCADLWVRQGVIDRDTLFMARHRVQKYRRQIVEGPHNSIVFSDRPFGEMLMQYRNVMGLAQDAKVLEMELLTDKGYGDW